MKTLSQLSHSKCIPPPVSGGKRRLLAAVIKIGVQTMVMALLAAVMVGCNAKTNAQSARKTEATNTISLVPLSTNSASISSNTIATVPEPIIPLLTNDVAPLNPPVDAPVLALQEETHQVIKLAQAGLSDTVIKAYITRSTNVFQLASEDIVYLNDIGISSEIIEAMLAHDNPQGSVPPIAQVPANKAATVAVAVVPVIEVSSNYVPNSGTIPNAPTVPDAPTVAPPEASPAQVITALPPQQQVTYQYFQNSLTPYGTWVTIPGYGVCWQPTVATTVVDWRPYGHSGRWLYSDYGWYWHSDYSWGWAPFHYGRWFRPTGYNWCWIPDTTWGPAWVSWRYSDAYCGWAPLPPAAHWRSGFGFSYHDSHVGSSFGFNLSWDYFTVVSYSRLCERRPFDHHIARPQAEHFHKNSTVVNISANHNHAMINHGVPRDRVSRASRSEVPQVSVRDVPHGSRNSIRPEQLTRDGSKLVVHRQAPNSHQTQAADIIRSSQEVRRSQTPNPLRAAPVTVGSPGVPVNRGRVRSSPIDVTPGRASSPQLPGRTSPSVTPPRQESPFGTRTGGPERPLNRSAVVEQSAIGSRAPVAKIETDRPTIPPARPNATPSFERRPSPPTQTRPVTPELTINPAPAARPEPRPITPTPTYSRPPVNFNRPAIVTTPNPGQIIATPAPAAAPIVRSFTPTPPPSANRPTIATTPNPRPAIATPAPAPTPAYRAPGPTFRQPPPNANQPAIVANPSPSRAIASPAPVPAPAYRAPGPTFRQPPPNANQPAIVANPSPSPASPSPERNPRNPNSGSNPPEKNNGRREPTQR